MCAMISISEPGSYFSKNNLISKKIALCRITDSIITYIYIKTVLIEGQDYKRKIPYAITKIISLYRRGVPCGFVKNPETNRL